MILQFAVSSLPIVNNLGSICIHIIVTFQEMNKTPIKFDKSKTQERNVDE